MELHKTWAVHITIWISFTVEASAWRAVIGLLDLVEELRVVFLSERMLRDMVHAGLSVEYMSLAAY
jgi:hypothetical protein